jgi:hypothetical protein
MAFVVGLILALLISVFARLTGLDRDRAFYPTLLIVIALYYILFAVMGGSARALGAESIQLVVFTVIAVVGFRSSLWWVAAGLVGHGVFDFFHGALVSNPGVPAWWPMFCGAADLVLGAFLAGLLYRGVALTHPAAPSH